MMFIDYIAILSLVIVMILLVIDRYFFTEQQQRQTKQVLEELSRTNKALISKNANDYVMTTAIDQVPKDQVAEPNPDEVLEDQLSDKEFFDALAKQKVLEKK